MKAFFALLRKQLIETRMFLFILAAALFFISWLSVYFTVKTEKALRNLGDIQRQVGTRGFLRGMGGPGMDYTSPAIELAFWNHPFLILTFVLWPISRGSAAVAGEIEKGSLDFVLSRPISRTAYLLSQAVVLVLGLAVLALALMMGNMVSGQFNAVQTATDPAKMVFPAFNLFTLGLAIYGFTVVVSSIDIVRWKATLVGSVITLGSYILHVVVNLPQMDEWQGLDKLSIFRAYYPVSAYTQSGWHYQANTGILTGIWLVGLVVGLFAFSYRDLPCNS